MHTETLPPSPSARTPFAVWLGRAALAVFTSLTLMAFGAGTLLGAYQVQYRGRIFPGVSVWGMDLSGRTAAEAADLVAQGFRYPQQAAFTFRDADRAWTVTPGELGVSLDLPTTVLAAYRVGRSGDWLQDLSDQFWAWYGGYSLPPVVAYDAGRTQAFLDGIAQEINRSPIEAALGLNGVEVSVQSGQVGREMDVQANLAVVGPSIAALTGAEVPLVVQESPPAVLDVSAQAALAQGILSQPLTLVVSENDGGGAGPWTFDPATLAGMLGIRRVEDGQGARYEVGLDEAQLRTFLEGLAEALARKAENPRFVFNDETRELELLQPGRTGRTLDVDASLDFIETQLVQGGHTIPLKFIVEYPRVADDARAADLGITQAVSVQSTWYAGSSAERIQNIRTAAAQFHGVLVPPGETFSAVETLGDVSLDKGYAEAWIIYAGRTIKGVGGGVCQVSTTLFRAAFFGGYPTNERYSHAYRVGYYEKGFGPGLDATVFAPLVDFKFTNDTPDWLLMETYVYPRESRLEWKFYSTSDGRTVEVGKPVIINVVPHPEPLYEENPDLPPGIENMKQVDFAADGADVSVTRVVRRDGRVLYEDLVKTRYMPWRAIYQYGPGTELPTPTPLAEGG